MNLEGVGAKKTELEQAREELVNSLRRVVAEKGAVKVPKEVDSEVSSIAVLYSGGPVGVPGVGLGGICAVEMENSEVYVHVKPYDAKPEMEIVVDINDILEPEQVAKFVMEYGRNQ